MDFDREYSAVTDEETMEVRYLDGLEITKRVKPTGEIIMTASPSEPAYYSPSAWGSGMSSSDYGRAIMPSTFSGGWTSERIEMPPELLASTMEAYDWDKIIRTATDEIPEMNMYKEEVPQSMDKRYAVNCKNPRDFELDKILKNLSIMKSKLMMECMPVHLRNIECKMTPQVKDNLIKAYKKCNMYGKSLPFVARFDEYGNRLSDQINIETLEGMTIQIVDPEHYGEFYLEFQGVVTDLFKKKEK